MRIGYTLGPETQPLTVSQLVFKPNFELKVLVVILWSHLSKSTNIKQYFITFTAASLARKSMNEEKKRSHPCDIYARVRCTSVLDGKRRIYCSADTIHSLRIFNFELLSCTVHTWFHAKRTFMLPVSNRSRFCHDVSLWGGLSTF